MSGQAFDRFLDLVRESGYHVEPIPPKGTPERFRLPCPLGQADHTMDWIRGETGGLILGGHCRQRHAEASVAALRLPDATWTRSMLELADVLHQGAVSEALTRLQVQAEARQRFQAEQHGGGGIDSWLPVDLDPYVNGKIEAPEPTVGLQRSDGLHLLYPGKEHSVFGEMESGKTWFALACAVAEMVKGDHVAYIHFEEADAASTVERLMLLGATGDMIKRLLMFVAPDRPLAAGDLNVYLDAKPSLVVLDGTNEGMALHGWKVMEVEGAAAFRQHLIRPFTGVGAAVLLADHVVKDKDSRGRYQFGSIHKGNANDGTMILLETAEPFGRGMRGRSHLFVTKNRAGHLRQEGRPTNIIGKTHMGELVVDDTRSYVSYLDVTFFAPAAPKETEADPDQEDSAEIDEVVLAAVAELTADPETDEVNRTEVRVRLGLRQATVSDSLERLRQAGRLRMRKRGMEKLFRPPPVVLPVPGVEEEES